MEFFRRAPQRDQPSTNKRDSALDSQQGQAQAQELSPALQDASREKSSALSGLSDSSLPRAFGHRVPGRAPGLDENYRMVAMAESSRLAISSRTGRRSASSLTCVTMPTRRSPP